jgi:cell division septation protein DedD
MKKVFIPMVILAVLFLFCACSKDEDVAQLEQETIDAQTTDYQTDSATGEEETVGEVDLAENEYATTPETTPEEEPVAVPTSNYGGMGGYTIQVGSGTNYENVKYIMQKYLDRGYDAFITEAYINDELVYRLRIGNFENYSEAKAMALELEDKYSAKFWIAVNE